jgi:acyl-CoA reductase-like NAD-dependent aldehyde dehydrogenase
MISINTDHRGHLRAASSYPNTTSVARANTSCIVIDASSNNSAIESRLNSRHGATFENENPAFRGSNVGLFQSSTPEDVLDAITVADNAYRLWKRTSVAERQGHIAEFLRLLKENREELARIVTLENGKTIRELQMLAGHASITATQRYMNARANSLAESMRQARERRVNRVEHADEATVQIG